MKVLWETEFRKQLADLLKEHGIELSADENMDEIYNEIGYQESARCKLLVEVDDHWENKVINVLKNKT